MTRRTDSEFTTAMQTVQGTKANGLIIRNMDKELKCGPMVLFTRAHLSKVIKKARANSSGRTETRTTASSETIIFKGTERTRGPTETVIWAHGLIIRCTAKARSPGPTEGILLVLISTI